MCLCGALANQTRTALDTRHEDDEERNRKITANAHTKKHSVECCGDGGDGDTDDNAGAVRVFSISVSRSVDAAAYYIMYTVRRMIVEDTGFLDCIFHWCC